jgi:hypothetical protein
MQQAARTAGLGQEKCSIFPLTTQARVFGTQRAIHKPINPKDAGDRFGFLVPLPGRHLRLLPTPLIHARIVLSSYVILYLAATSRLQYVHNGA